MINVDGSSIYENNGVKHFSYKFIVSQWVPNMRVHLSFAEPVANLEAHQGAAVVDQYYYYGSSDDTLVIVQLDDAPHSAASSEFLIIGTGTNEMNMGISCTGNEAPPPSPPHPDDCTLGPQYHVRRQWPDGEEAELYFNTWVETQRVRLRYWGEQIDIRTSGGSATLATLTFEEGVTTATLQLGPASGGTVVKLLLSPPAYHRPKILCHEAWLPPPPPPPPSSPPPGPPPPNPPPPSPLASIEASYECALGGVARVMNTRMVDSQTRWMHVVVQPDTWTIGYVVLVGVLGSGVVVDGVTHASLEGGDGRVGPNLFAFVLQHPRAGAAASFGFNLRGREAEIASLTCRVGSPPPPQQAAAPATDTYSYDYDEPSEALDAPETSPEPSKESADTLDDLLTSALVLLVLATGCCAAYQSRHTIKLRLDRLAATSSWARTIRNLMPAGASEAELSVFDDGAHDGELNDAARRAARKGRRGPSSTTRINPVDDHDDEEDEDADDDHDDPEPRAQPSRQAKDGAAAKKDADDDVFSTALVLRQGEMRELD